MRSILPLLLVLAACKDEDSGGDDTHVDESAIDDTEPQVVDEDGDGVPAEEDCDDADATVFPGADEVCDGRDNDCDGQAEAGAEVSWRAAGGSWTDASAWFAGPDAEMVPLVPVGEAGELCLRPRADAYVGLVRSTESLTIGSAGTERAVLSGGGAGTTVTLVGEGLSLTLDGVRVRDGVARSGGDCVGDDVTPAGGGVCCMGADNRLVMHDVEVADSRADRGGGLFSQGCAVEANALELRGNHAAGNGGGASVVAGSLRLTDGVVEGNSAGSNGGGLYLKGSLRLGQRLPVTVEGTRFTDNVADSYGGAVYLYELVDMTCSGGALLRNVGQVFGGAAYLFRDSSLSSDACDWGEGDDDNHVETRNGPVITDISAPDNQLLGVYEGAASFACSVDPESNSSCTGQ